MNAVSRYKQTFTNTHSIMSLSLGPQINNKSSEKLPFPFLACALVAPSCSSSDVWHPGWGWSVSGWWWQTAAAAPWQLKHPVEIITFLNGEKWRKNLSPWNVKVHNNNSERFLTIISHHSLYPFLLATRLSYKFSIDICKLVSLAVIKYDIKFDECIYFIIHESCWLQK